MGDEVRPAKKQKFVLDSTVFGINDKYRNDPKKRFWALFKETGLLTPHYEKISNAFVDAYPWMIRVERDDASYLFSDIDKYHEFFDRSRKVGLISGLIAKMYSGCDSLSLLLRQSDDNDVKHINDVEYAIKRMCSNSSVILYSDQRRFLDKVSKLTASSMTSEQHKRLDNITKAFNGH